MGCSTYFSIKSTFHGFSAVFCIFIFIGCPATLFLINNAELFKGPESDCWASNQQPFYGQDNVLYCPNTRIVSSTNFTITSTQLPRIVLFDDVPPMREDKEYVEGVSYYNLYDHQNSLYWSFNWNKGTIFRTNVTTTDGTGKVHFYFDDKKITTIEAPGFYEYETTIEADGGHVMKLSSSDDINGITYFYVNQTLYDFSNPTANCSIFKGNCTLDYDFGEKACIGFTYETGYRNWNYKSISFCLTLVQTGFDHIWIPTVVSVYLAAFLLIAIANCIVFFFTARDAKKRAAAKSPYVSSYSSSSSSSGPSYAPIEPKSSKFSDL